MHDFRAAQAQLLRRPTAPKGWIRALGNDSLKRFVPDRTDVGERPSCDEDRGGLFPRTRHSLHHRGCI